MPDSQQRADKRVARFLEIDPHVRFRTDDDLNIIRNARGILSRQIFKTKEEKIKAGPSLIASNPDSFGAINAANLKLVTEEADIHGGNTFVYQQFHEGIKVYGGSIRFHFNEKGVLDNIANTLFPDILKLSFTPVVTDRKAIEITQVDTRCKNEPSKAPELLIYRIQKKPFLVWEVKISEDDKTNPPHNHVTGLAGDHGAPHMWVVYIDAVSGKVLLKYDNVQTAGPSTGSGSGYYSGAGTLQSWNTDSGFQLRDTTRTGAGGPEIITNDEDGGSPSADPDNNWNAAAIVPRDAHQGPEVDAHRYVANVIDYFKNVHGRNSYDNLGAAVNILVHYGTNYNNGSWDGTRIKLGDGTGAAPGDDYECTDDWLAHELTHAYTQFTCNLQYLNESGALNEAFSDIFAAFITGDWLVFEDSWLKASAPASRNMIEPTNGGLWNPADAITSVLAGHQPSHYSQRYSGGFDNGGVHINSGIINHLFYLLTAGGTHGISGITVSGIGQSAAEQLLFRCMTVNLVGNPTASFIDFREAMLDACLDLFPSDLNKLTQVKNAFLAVGVGPDLYIRDNTADTGVEPFTGSYLYASPDIINRTAIVANPAVSFANMGDDNLWQNVEFGQDNFVYVRLQNRGSSNGDATINVYFSAATTFGTPASWIHVGTSAEVGIAPGAVRISGPITFPTGLIPAVGHYCMIAVITNTLDPAPDHTLIASVSDYLAYVRNTNNIAYRNMDVVNNVLPGAVGMMTAVIRNFNGIRAHFDLKIDIRRFFPGAIIRIKGPSKYLDAAIPLGLKLVVKREGMSFYEPEKDSKRLGFLANVKWNGYKKIDEVKVIADKRGVMAFGEMLVEKDFTIEIEYTLPEKEIFEQNIKRLPVDGYQLNIQQFHKGENVGGVGIKIIKPGKIIK